ncbi:MAG: nucleoside hydrolase [Geminicoccaceae bacterium]|nr:nucleoside hydrolase [Geminicoccaceae bacterium]
MTKLLFVGDPGIDDAVAISCAARWCDLVGIVATHGNAPADATARNALALCELVGLAVPVARGCARSIMGEPASSGAALHGGAGIAGATLAEPKGELDPRPGVDLLIETARAHAGELVVALTGAHTDLALALRLEPHLASWLRAITVMGGTAGIGNARPMACLNILADPEAAAIVATAGVPLLWIGYELTRTVLLGEAELARLEAGGRVARTMAGALRFYRERYRRIYGIDGAPIHDALAVLAVAPPGRVPPGVLRFEPTSLEVVCTHGPARGMTIVDRRGIRTSNELPPDRRPLPPNVHYAVEIDRRAAVEAVVEALVSLR